MTIHATTRRSWLQNSACGFGSLALGSMLAEQSAKADNNSGAASLVERQPMFPARAKRVIFIFMQGGPSQVDTFDYKPERRSILLVCELTLLESSVNAR
jgi:hypothetical protein